MAYGWEIQRLYKDIITELQVTSYVKVIRAMYARKNQKGSQNGLGGRPNLTWYYTYAGTFIYHTTKLPVSDMFQLIDTTS